MSTAAAPRSARASLSSFVVAIRDEVIPTDPFTAEIGGLEKLENGG